LFDYVNRRKNYKADRRSAAKLSLNQSRGAPPGQIAGSLRALIHAANLAREQGLAAVPDDAIAGELRLFRHGVAVGLSQIRRAPGSNEKQPPGRLLLECLRDRRADVLRFLSDLRIPPTSNQADYAEFGVMRTRRWMPWHAGEAGRVKAA